ncbi:T9SS type A sorting domain-containing protein [Ekhidna sp.]|uniref:T9SS type A sorting domain-containing protein n=1 Tax=Ekhidna sp. TaxID=2608089 RepID=UPI003BAA7DCB
MQLKITTLLLALIFANYASSQIYFPSDTLELGRFDDIYDFNVTTHDSGIVLTGDFEDGLKLVEYQKIGNNWLADTIHHFTSGFATGVTYSDGKIAVGMNGAEVYIFKKDALNEWQHNQTITKGSTDGYFGSVLKMDGDYLAIKSDNIVRVYVDVGNWVLLYSFFGPDNSFGGLWGGLDGMGFYDNKLILSSSSALNVYDLLNGSTVVQYNGINGGWGFKIYDDIIYTQRDGNTYRIFQNTIIPAATGISGTRGSVHEKVIATGTFESITIHYDPNDINSYQAYNVIPYGDDCFGCFPYSVDFNAQNLFVTVQDQFESDFLLGRIYVYERNEHPSIQDLDITVRSDEIFAFNQSLFDFQDELPDFEWVRIESLPLKGQLVGIANKTIYIKDTVRVSDLVYLPPSNPTTDAFNITVLDQQLLPSLSNNTVNVTIELPNIKQYEIEQVPDLLYSMHNGDTIRFQVYKKSLSENRIRGVKIFGQSSGYLQFNVDGMVQGVYDSMSHGLFEYSASVSDVEDIELEFYAIDENGDSTFAVTYIEQFPNLPGEYDLVEFQNLNEVPPSYDKEYLIYNESSIGTKYFNGAERDIKKVIIIGKELNFQQGHPTKLYSALNGREDIDELVVYAEKLTMDGTEIKIPGAHLNFKIDTLYLDQRNYIDLTPTFDLNNDTTAQRFGKVDFFVNTIVNGIFGQFSRLQFFDDVECPSSYGLLCAYDTTRTNLPANGTSQIRFPSGFREYFDHETWFDAIHVNTAINYADDLYLLGRYDLMIPYLKKYQAYIDTYINYARSNDVNLDQDLILNKNDLEELLFRIETNRDYFGNPPGWVPRLSFEASLSLFEEEVDNYINVYYLNYWILNANASIEEKINALETARDFEKNQIRIDRNSIKSFRQQLDQLNLKSERIANQLNTTRNQLISYEIELKRRAQNEVNRRRRKRRKRGFWKAIGSVLQILPVPGQPAFAAVGTAINFIAEVEYSEDRKLTDIDTIIDGVTTISKAFRDKNSNLAKARNKFGDFIDQIDLDEISLDKEYIKQIKDNYNELGKPLVEQSQKFLKDYKQIVNIPKNEYGNILSNLRANDPNLKALVDRISSLQSKQVEVTESIISVNQQIVTLATIIPKRINAIDIYSTQISENILSLDESVLVYLQDLLQLSKNRLLKYHYYLIKSYEYRFLEKYSVGNLFEIPSFFEKIIELVDQSNGSFNLSVEDFNALRAIYDDELARLANIIYEEFQNGLNSKILESRKVLSLNDELLAQLNEDGEVIFNPYYTGLFSVVEDNIRIKDINVTYLKASNAAAEDINDYMDIRINYPMNSLITNEGRTYLINNQATNNANPISWDFRYFSYSETTEKLESNFDPQLIKFLLSRNNIAINSDNISIFYQPAMIADLILEKERFSSDAGITIDSLVLEIEYYFSRNYSPSVEIFSFFDGKPSNNIKPYYRLDLDDNHSRRDGRGNIVRYFDPGSQLSIVPEKSIGKYEFSGWIYEDSSISEDTLTLEIFEPMRVQAHYELKEPILRVEPDTLYAFNTDSFAITNIGNDEMDWLIRNSNEWISIQNDTVGLDDQNVIITVDEATSTRSGYVYVYASDAKNFVDSVFVIQEVNSGQVVRPQKPNGPNIVCSSSMEKYFTEEIENVDQYIWTLTPEEAGTILANGSRFVDIVWSNTYEGMAQLSVQGVNSENQSEVSAPSEIEIYTSIEPALEIDGPLMVCEGESAKYQLIGIGLSEESKIVWIVNNERIDSTSNDFIFFPKNNDVIRAEITNTIMCANADYLITQPIQIESILDGVPSVSINGQPDYCPNELAILSATFELGGVNPIFTWYVDGIEFSSQESIELDESYDGRLISLTMLADQECLENPVAIAEPLIISYVPTTAPDLYLENDSIRSTRTGYDHEWTVNGRIVSNYSASVIEFDRSVEYIARSYSDDCYSEYSDPLIILEAVDHQRNPFIIYPNPVINHLNFQNQTNKRGILSLNSISGELMADIEVNANSKKRIDFSSFAPGTYIINFRSEGRNFVETLIKVTE